MQFDGAAQRREVLERRTHLVQEHFPGAMSADDFLARVEAAIAQARLPRPVFELLQSFSFLFSLWFLAERRLWMLACLSCKAQ